MSSRDDRVRLLDILTAIDEIERHVGNRSKRAFVDDMTATDAVAYRLVIIGEAVSRLPPELLAFEPGVPWAEIRALRNRLVHAYFGVDLDIMWSIVQIDLLPLQAATKRLLDRISQ